MLTAGTLVGALFLLLLHSVSVVSSLSSSSPLNDDVLALIVFKAGLIDPLSRLDSWSEEDDSACSWVGVKCDKNSSRVSELILDGFSLSGHLGKSLVRLQNLTVLQLSRNSFSGNVNPILGEIPSLRVLDLSDNSFSGLVPKELFQQCGNLREISLARNSFSGSIPESLSSCSNLETLNFSSNHLSGQLPSEIWSLTSLHSLDLSDNGLEGKIVSGIERLQRLKTVNLSKNKFVGWLPESMGRCLHLRSVDLSMNYFTGSIPLMNKLGFCRYLDLRGNFLTGEIPDWIGEMRSLEVLDLSSNRFSGRISSAIGDLQSLKEVNLSRNQFTESLPLSLESCMSLKVVDLSQNLLTGSLPCWVFKLSLESLRLSANRFGGNITFPSTWLPSYESLQVLDLSSNALSGEIPSAIVNFSRLQELDVSWNGLVGPIPTTVGELKSAFTLDLSHNKLSGSIPLEIGEVITLQELRLENNTLAGEIPISIGNCSSLTSLFLSHNNLSGAVPVEISKLSSLKLLDLSFNNFSGSIPKELASLSQLSLFNVSFNCLEGELPTGGIFNTISPSSVAGNPSLCGSIVKLSCPSVHPKPLVLNPNSSVSKHGPVPQNVNHKQLVLSISSLVAIGAAVFIALGVVLICILNIHARTSKALSVASLRSYGGNEFSPSHDTEANYGKLVMFSGDAEFDTGGAHSLLNKNCELGYGGFGSVYKTELQKGRSVAIKKLNATSLVKSQQYFEQEVKQLGKIRHQNLVALEGYYWTPSLQLLINEYVPAGSLYHRLHDSDSDICLSWQQRFRILIGTARALAHLHQINVIHYNIKSKNVLIDSSGEPKLGDFGLARILPALDHYILSSKIQSALGYMAPEFACQTVKITEKCDVYGFGILILEVVSGRKPVEYMEDDVIVLCDVVKQAVDASRFEECIDSKLKGKYALDQAISAVKLALACASQVPSNRPDMEEVLRILQMIIFSHGNKEEAE